jgi:predicted metalloprotease with PDZ domain
MYPPSMRSAPLSLRIDAPDTWRVATGLEQDRDDPTLFIAPNYDVLVDSPLEIGEHEVLTFEVEGIPHEIVIWNPTTQKRTLDDKRITGDFEKIVREQFRIFGRLPYRRYVFLIHCYPAGGGGTEHLNSTIMGCKPEALRENNAFKKFLGLVSHEFFHTWNVKQFRPAGIHPYDYQRENYTNLLWVAEGTTSYYDDLTLARAGLTTPDDYLKTLSTAIDALRRRPGAKVQSLSESSYDAWIKFNKTTPDSANSTVSFYDKGALVSFLLDLEIRRASRGRHSLDDLMRAMDREFPLAGPGYTHDHVVALAERLAGADLGGFFARFVDGTADLPFEELVGLVGLELRQGDPDKPETKPYLGLSIDSSGSVTAVASNGPAYATGLVAGDSLVAANNQRIRSQGDLDGHINSLKPGDELRLTYFRYDTLRSAVLLLGSQPGGKWVLRRLEKPTDEQKEAYRNWLGQDWPAK